jgi:DNA mismatch repair protein MutS2
VEVKIEQAAPRRMVSEFSTPFTPQLGKRVRLRNLDTEGVVTSLTQDEAEVMVGNMRMRVKLQDLTSIKETPEAPTENPSRRTRQASAEPESVEPTKPTFVPSPGMEIDLRGQRAEDALDILDRYLDSAVVSGMPFVRVIHGKGTGRLRQVIREALHENVNVTSFEQGADNEGGEGVTIVHLDTK